MRELQPGEMIGFDPTPMQEKARLDGLRLECLRLAQTERDNEPVLAGGRPLADIARDLFDFVTDAPKRPDLFAVRRMDEVEQKDDLGPRDYLTITGCFVSWGFEAHAFRFRSKAEAEAAIVRHVEAAFSGVGGVALVVPLPSYMDPF